MIGRTIVGLEQQDDYTWLLRLDDGTAVEFAARGWEVEEATLTHLTPEVQRQREVDAENERREREEERHRQEEASTRRQAHIAEIRAKLGPVEFEKWRRETYPTLNEMLKDTWTGPLVEQMTTRSVLLDLMDR